MDPKTILGRPVLRVEGNRRTRIVRLAIFQPPRFRMGRFFFLLCLPRMCRWCGIVQEVSTADFDSADPGFPGGLGTACRRDPGYRRQYASVAQLAGQPAFNR